jgi:hypothetical protein
MGSAIAARTITNLLGLILRHGLSIKLPEFFGTGRLQFTSSRLWPSLSGNFRIARQGSPPDGKGTAADRAKVVSARSEENPTDHRDMLMRHAASTTLDDAG